MKNTVLILPGINNSCPQHWQSLWQASLPNCARVMQADWDNPVLTHWLANLEAHIAQTEGSVYIAAHSLGCHLLAHWAQTSENATKVKRALLVAPPGGKEVAALPQIQGFLPLASRPLPFAAVGVVSTNDPYDKAKTGQAWLEKLGCEVHSLGDCGHINADSGLGNWAQGLAWLRGA